ncbi:clostridial MutS2-related protein [Lachnospiraceae bacterium KM106-2]|nr:clostridial MutS2-related protein [Lachnospiraceae bacterium KM106-2]
MNQTFENLGYTLILQQLQEYTSTNQAKQMIQELKPFLSELELRKNLKETSEARKMLDLLGTPPIPSMERIDEFITKAVQGELIEPDDIESIGRFLAAVRRMKDYLEKGSKEGLSLAFYYENLDSEVALRELILQCIRNGRVDDQASSTLAEIRRDLLRLEDKIKQKGEASLRNYKAYLSENFVVTRNGRICIPIKSQYKHKVKGSVIDKSATGSTLFIEPDSVSKLQDEYEQHKIEEDTEERRILYWILDEIAKEEAALRENIRVIGKLDFVFAKGKLSVDMNAATPEILTEHYIYLKNARHPHLNPDQCVPLTIELGREKKGMIITGPNTGGKTVTIKTVGLMSLMACSGLHVPCEIAKIGMSSQVLCDIGDGQNMKDNLSTFSAHITNIISILKRMNEESFIILDELGSGTDPQEGMGIAIAILEEIRKSGCLFLVTTHYPDVKSYATRHPEIENARMAFDREALKPLYQLEVGEAGESCALYIAKRLGLPETMLEVAAKEAYKEESEAIIAALCNDTENRTLKKEKSARIKKQKADNRKQMDTIFSRGDSVQVNPDGKLGIVVQSENEKGLVLVQVQKEKFYVNQKRLTLKVKADQLYPPDYDFSILFDSVKVRKARHQMLRKYEEGLEITIKE